MEKTVGFLTSATEFISIASYLAIAAFVLYLFFKWFKKREAEQESKQIDLALAPKRQLIDQKLASVKNALTTEPDLYQHYDDYAQDYFAWKEANHVTDVPEVDQVFFGTLSEAFIDKGIRPPASYRKYFRMPFRIPANECPVYTYTAPASIMKKTYETYSESETAQAPGFFKKGVRAGSSHSVRVEGLEERSMGDTAITLTDKALYISGSGHTEKIPYNDIAVASIGNNSIEITKNRAPETPIYIYATPQDMLVTYKAIYGTFAEPRNEGRTGNRSQRKRNYQGNQRYSQRHNRDDSTIQ